MTDGHLISSRVHLALRSMDSTREVSGLNLGLLTDSTAEDYRDFTKFFQADSRIVLRIKQRFKIQVF
jgi:hypothetical protein